MSTRTASIQEEKLESSNFDDGTNSLFTYACGKAVPQEGRVGGIQNRITYSIPSENNKSSTLTIMK